MSFSTLFAHDDRHVTINRPKKHSGALVAPKNLRDHRTTHDFMGPCCFCPALSSENTSDFVEAAIFDRGHSEFVAMCPTDNCGYLGA